MQRMGRRATAAYVTRRLEDLHRAWKVGDCVAPFKGAEATTITAVDGDRVTLANGQGGHVSRLTKPREES